MAFYYLHTDESEGHKPCDGWYKGNANKEDEGIIGPIPTIEQKRRNETKFDNPYNEPMPDIFSCETMVKIMEQTFTEDKT
jgi:hypothetical protein